MVRRLTVKKFASVLVLSSLGIVAVWAQSSDSAASAQTARQALVEMFFGKTPGTFAKHLPAATLTVIDKSGAMATLQQYSALASQFQTTGKSFETFDSGSLLLTAEDAQSSQKFEIMVEKDSLAGDEDNIEVSFRIYREKQLQRTPFFPRMTFGMKREAGIWKLNDLEVTVRLPLADPDFLKSVIEGVKSRSGAATSMQTSIQTPATGLGSEASVVAAMETIVKAENTYASTYRGIGYTCAISDLDGFGGGEPNEHQAMLIPSGLAGGRKYGYTFTLSGCGGSPATTIRLVAVPGINSLGRRALCSDQSGAIRYSADANPAGCGAGSLAER
jgi:hypothetical protein